MMLYPQMFVGEIAVLSISPSGRNTALPPFPVPRSLRYRYSRVTITPTFNHDLRPASPGRRCSSATEMRCSRPRRRPRATRGRWWPRATPRAAGCATAVPSRSRSRWSRSPGATTTCRRSACARAPRGSAAPRRTAAPSAGRTRNRWGNAQTRKRFS